MKPAYFYTAVFFIIICAGCGEHYQNYAATMEEINNENTSDLSIDLHPGYSDCDDNEGDYLLMPQDNEDNRGLIPIILFLEQLSLEEFLNKYDREILLDNPDCQAINRVALVRIKEDLWNPCIVEIGDRLLFDLFDGLQHIALVKDITYYGNEKDYYLRGQIEETESGLLIISVDNGILSFSIEIPEDNVLYNLIFNDDDTNYYLYKLKLDQLEQPGMH